MAIECTPMLTALFGRGDFMEEIQRPSFMSRISKYL